MVSRAWKVSVATLPSPFAFLPCFLPWLNVGVLRAKNLLLDLVLSLQVQALTQQGVCPASYRQILHVNFDIPVSSYSAALSQ